MELIKNYIKSNEYLQQKVFDDSSLDINFKISVLKECSNNPFLKMSSEEIDELFKNDDINLSSIIMLINLRKEYDKLDMIPNKENLKESENKYLELSDFEKVILSIVKFKDYKQVSKVRINDIDLDKIFKQKDDQYYYELLLKEPKLKKLFIDRIIAEFSSTEGYLGVGNFFFLHRDHEKMSEDESRFVQKLFTDKDFQEKFYSDKVFSRQFDGDIPFIYLPKDKKFYLGNSAPFMSSDKKEYEKRANFLKGKYREFYPDIDERTMDIIIQCQFGDFGIDHLDIIQVILKLQDQNPEFLKKLNIFLEKMDIWFTPSEIARIIRACNTYEGLFDYVINAPEITSEIKMKISYLLGYPKLQGVDNIEQILNTSLEELSNKPIEMESAKKAKFAGTPWGTYFEKGKSVSNEGSHGAVIINSEGEEKTAFGSYHEDCLINLYAEKSQTGVLYDNIMYGLSEGDIVMLVEGNSTVFVSNKKITRKQLDKIIKLVQESDLKDRLRFIVQIATEEDFVELNNGDEMGPKQFLEALKHFEVVESLDQDKKKAM